MKNIQIHGVDADGEHYVLNEMRGDNANVDGASGAEQEKLRDSLLRHCQIMAMRWQYVFPRDVIRVAETRGRGR